MARQQRREAQQRARIGSPHDCSERGKALVHPARHVPIQRLAVVEAAILQILGARVRGSNQEIDAAGTTSLLQHRLDRVAAEIGGDRYGVGLPEVEERPGVGGLRRPDIAALGVDDHRDLHPARKGQDVAQRLQPVEPVLLEESEVGLDRRRDQSGLEQPVEHGAQEIGEGLTHGTFDQRDATQVGIEPEANRMAEVARACA